MPHTRDRDHPHPPQVPPPHEPGSHPKPDQQRVEHPTPVPRAPVDPRTHPSRRIFAR
jgi:hypothetical protein